MFNRIDRIFHAIFYPVDHILTSSQSNSDIGKDNLFITDTINYNLNYNTNAENSSINKVLYHSVSTDRTYNYKIYYPV